MNGRAEMPSAEVVDNELRLIALIMLVIALNKAVEAAGVLMPEASLIATLNVVDTVLQVMIFVLIGAIVFWKVRVFLRVPKHRRHLFFDPDGFTKEIFKKACIKSWAITLVALSLAGPLTKRIPPEIPPKFFIEATIAVMLAGFSLTFFYLYRVNDGLDEGAD